jgi:protein-S-isoprenylcysteine O-methyltransferase Ste14
VLVTCLILIAMVWQWRPVPEVVWSFDNPIAQVILLSIFGTGWVVVLASSFLIDHFDLFGLRQSYFCLRGWEYKHPVFVKRAFYKYVRHPLMVGFLLAVWATPTMTVGHLIFALGITGYILLGTLIEERDLVKLLGEDYREYQRTTPKFIPIPRLGAEKKPVVATEEA